MEHSSSIKINSYIRSIEGNIKGAFMYCPSYEESRNQKFRDFYFNTWIFLWTVSLYLLKYQIYALMSLKMCESILYGICWKLSKQLEYAKVYLFSGNFCKKKCIEIGKKMSNNSFFLLKYGFSYFWNIFLSFFTSSTNSLIVDFIKTRKMFDRAQLMTSSV